MFIQTTTENRWDNRRIRMMYDEMTYYPKEQRAQIWRRRYSYYIQAQSAEPIDEEKFWFGLFNE